MYRCDVATSRLYVRVALRMTAQCRAAEIQAKRHSMYDDGNWLQSHTELCTFHSFLGASESPPDSVLRHTVCVESNVQIGATCIKAWPFAGVKFF